MRIRRQILRRVDKDSQDGYTDQTVISTIGMKGEDKALGYTWDYRDYGARNPQAYNDPKLLEAYRRQDEPEYRNLTWLHSGTKDTKIRHEERKNEELALTVADRLTGFVNPNPRVKAPILAGIRNLKNIKPTITGSDPLLAGAGNIRIPANGNVAKGDRIPDTALASKEIKHKNRKDQLGKNKKSGEDFEMEIYQKKVKQGFKPQKQITVKTKSGVKTRLDIISKEGGLDVCTECKASITAPLTKNQKKAFPEIERTGATVVGKGKPGYPKGTKIKPTKVIIERKR